MKNQVAVPSEGRNLSITRRLGRSLGQARFIETQCVSNPVPKQEGWCVSAPATDQFAEGIAEPDPPDKRRRPPRANRRALVIVFTWAAADPEYANAELRSSTSLTGRPA